MTERLLVVVAHPDDETFGTGSLIAAAAKAGVEVTVCCATRGEAGEAHGVSPGADLAAVREGELRAAGAELGVHRIVLLDYRDSDMAGVPAEGTLCAADPSELVEAVRAVVAEVRPSVVVTLDPDHGDGHRDHATIGRATIDACPEDMRVYVFAVTRSLLARWFALMQEVRPDTAHLELDRQGLGRPDADITTVVDVRSVRGVRERAIALHRSQVPPSEGMPEDLLTDFLETDRLVRISPPWPGGPVETGLF
ncbi:MAG TPA: PIG-L deacetylase family protein [Jatrophihabitans sp.]|jgi:LmbE family N-acetylglucosaminyl deacetylase